MKPEPTAEAEQDHDGKSLSGDQLSEVAVVLYISHRSALTMYGGRGRGCLSSYPVSARISLGKDCWIESPDKCSPSLPGVELGSPQLLLEQGKERRPGVMLTTS